jgi:rRNA maturation RNase YbeY
VKDNALTFSKTLGEELGRVMAHGVLHLAGYTDKKAEQQLIMREKEDFYLGSFPNL